MRRNHFHGGAWCAERCAVVRRRLRARPQIRAPFRAYLPRSQMRPERALAPCPCGVLGRYPAFVVRDGCGSGFTSGAADGKCAVCRTAGARRFRGGNLRCGFDAVGLDRAVLTLSLSPALRQVAWRMSDAEGENARRCMRPGVRTDEKVRIGARFTFWPEPTLGCPEFTPSEPRR